MDIAATVNAVVEAGGVTDGIAESAVIQTDDIVCQPIVLYEKKLTHIALRRIPYQIGNRGKIDKRNKRLGRPADEAIVEFCSVPRTQTEIMELVDLSLTVVRQRYIDRLIKEGRLLLTKPFAPCSMHQQFVNSDNPQYVRDNDAIVAFCAEPKTTHELQEFIGLNRSTTLANLRVLIADGKLKNLTGGGAEHSGTGSRYVRAENE